MTLIKQTSFASLPRSLRRTDDGKRRIREQEHTRRAGAIRSNRHYLNGLAATFSNGATARRRRFTRLCVCSGCPPNCVKARTRLRARLPATDADIKGILHAHTDRSDRVHALETMAEATLARGYEYFGVADHSKSAHYAGGLSAAEVAEQQVEAERLNNGLPRIRRRTGMRPSASPRPCGGRSGGM